MKKLKRWFFKWFTGLDLEIMQSNQGLQLLNPFPQVAGLNDTYLFDFKNWSSQYNGVGDGATGGAILQAGMALGTPFISTDNVPAKIKIKPVDVLKELETIPTPFDLLGLDDKIMMLKTKEDLLVQYYAKREVTALIERLENRKKYNEHKIYFDSFQNTTDEKMDILLKKYELVMKTSDIFVPEFPDVAIKIIKEYEEKVKLICNKKAVFYVIAEAKDFVKKYEKRDPILLVQSPFGFYWQILGAWDKEMLLLSEL